MNNNFRVSILGYRPFRTLSNTLPEYLYKTAPNGEYDIKRSVDFMQQIDLNGNGLYDFNQNVQINGSTYATSELGNFLVGLNGYRSGLELDEIFNYGLAVEGLKLEQGNSSLSNELQDQKYYTAGYTYGVLEKKG
ncbi:MAG: hypothetical protein GY828_05820, partial [Candidatus Gracilibacteria bacterium]|nr:hypothetical protein [Candidatus Gracilibacteria bacterium]